MLLVQVIGGGGEHVRHIAPDVAFAVAGKVDGVVDDVGRHELRLAHGAGPGRDHAAAREAAVLHDLHGDQQFVAEVGVAVADEGERGQRAEHVPAVALGAVVGLDAPERGEGEAVDAELLFHLAEGLRPFADLALAARDAGARGDRVDVIAERLAVFRLALGGGDHARVGGDALHGAIERGARDALFLRVRPQSGGELGEGLLRLRVRKPASKARAARTSRASQRIGMRMLYVSNLLRRL